MTAGDGDLHVLVVVKGLGLGGAERLIVEQVRRAEGSGVRFTVAHVRPDKTHFVAELRAAGAEVEALGGDRRRPWPIRLARLIRAARPDVVHTHSPLPSVVVRAAVRSGLAGRPWVAYTEHNRWEAYRPPVRALNAATMWLDDQVWAVSAEARGSIRPPRLRRRADVLVHGIDVAAARVDAAAQALALDADPPPGADGTVLLHIANRRPEKAHEHVVAAFAAAAADRPDLHLWMVGQGLDDPRLVAAIAGCGAAERIAVLGYRDDALGLLRRADALVLGSRHEGLPVAVMEALAVGRPVVSTAVGGVPEAVRDGVEGLLVPPGDVDALAAAIRTIADDPARAAEMGAAAAARSHAFDGAVAAATQVDAYRAAQARARVRR